MSTATGSPTEILKFRKLMRDPAYWYERHIRNTPPGERQADVVAGAPMHRISDRQPMYMSDEKYKAHDEAFQNIVNTIYSRK